MTRVAMIGAGAVGCLYGVRMDQAGAEVHFLMRSDYETVKANGLSLRSPDGDFEGMINVHRDPAEIGPVDIAFCSMKAIDLPRAVELVRPVMGPETSVVVLMNGLNVEAPFVDAFGADRVLGGLAFVGVSRTAPGEVVHSEFGGLRIGAVSDAGVPRADSVVTLLQKAGVQSERVPSLVKGRWEKLMWNIPFSCVGTLAGGCPTDALMADEGLKGLCAELMRETLAVAEADGVPLNPDMPKKMFDATATMGTYRASMLLDLASDRELEVEAIVGEPLRAARRHGVETPHLAAVHALLGALNRRHQPAR